jgi:hypothetical protein
MLVAGLGAWILKILKLILKIFERTSIYVINGIGSRLFGNFNTYAGLLCSKIGKENKREFGALGELAISAREFPVALTRTENL